MTLTPEELRASRAWKHRWPTLLACLLVLAFSGFMGYLIPPPSLFYIPLALVDVATIFVLLRLMQLYHAPKHWKSGAMS